MVAIVVEGGAGVFKSHPEICSDEERGGEKHIRPEGGREGGRKGGRKGR